MSIESMSLALNLVDDRLTPTDKLLLVGIANHDGDGGAWPSMATLARYAGIEIRSVRKRLVHLEGLGYCRREVGAGGNSKTPPHERPTLYHLSLQPPVPEDPPVLQAPSPPVPQDTPPPVPQAPRTVHEPSKEPSIILSPDGDEFERWWSAYLQTERPGSKGDARRAWIKITKGQRHLALVAIHRHLGYIRDFPGRYVMPNGATWLNKYRWEDEMPQEPPRSQTNGHKGIAALAALREARGS
jgi:hypothetical protein